MSFQDLFVGNPERFLTFNPKSVNPRDADGKMKPQYRTVKRARDDGSELSTDEWAAIVEAAISDHLCGRQSYGLSPLRDGKVRFAALDIDLYPFLETPDEIEQLAKAWGDPCLIARTKSGGVHVYAFFDDWVAADKARRYIEIRRDATLKKAVREKAQEVFPKQDTGDGSQINLPQCGDMRPVLGWSCPGMIQLCNTKTKAGAHIGVDWGDVARKCRVTTARVMETLLDDLAVKPKEREKKEKPRWAGGFKRPTSGKGMEGRNSFLFSCGASARARGADDNEVAEVIRSVVEEFDDPSHPLHKREPLTDAEVNRVIQQVQGLEQGETKMSFSAVELMNEEWALMNVEGKVEFLNLKTGDCSNKESWALLNAPRMTIANAWLTDPDRLEFHGYVLEDPSTYDGRGFNMFRGHAVTPTSGDASLVEKYILEILCGGDPALAHWVTSWVADGIQRPWSERPGTALALRGPQGTGKSFLGYMITKALGGDLVLAAASSDTIVGKTNRAMFGKTFLLAEESLFVGSHSIANVLKNLVTAFDWRYEQKYLASFMGKNVHRLIATTNESQAVHIDFDDRRWTVIEVNRTCPFKSTTAEARAWWKPYYDLVEKRPGDVLRYFLEYEVDRDLIGIPHHTQAKAEDKTSSDPLVALFDEIAHSGVCPDDLRGDGRISTATLAREVYARGASRYTASRTFTNDARKRFGASTAKNCIHIKSTHLMRSGDGTMSVEILRRADRDGLQLPPLPEFRAIMAEVTGEVYPAEGDWLAFAVETPETGWADDPNDGGADVEKYVRDGDRVVKDDVPF